MSRDLPLQQAWEALSATALLGTSRRAFALPELDGPAGEVLRHLAAGQPDPSGERQLLSAAALLSVYRRAGSEARRLEAVPEMVCPEDEQPLPPIAVARRLALMLQGERAELVREWLQLAAGAGYRVHEELLPALLEMGRARSGLAPLILPVLGQRGRWLAEQNSAWRYARQAADLPETIWQTGDQARRLALLQELRRSDPGAGRALVESTWQSESVQERMLFLAAFATGLNMTDEPFLEAALDDRSKEVRRSAAGLLVRMPHARLVQRMRERLQPLVQLKPGGLLHRAGLVVRLPEACTAAMQRDGIEAKPPANTKLGERAYWLRQMAGCVPPSVWSQDWQKPPQEILRMAGGCEWKEALYEGWSAAAVNFQDADWALALLEVSPGSTQLLDVLTPAQREQLLLAGFQAGGLEAAYERVLRYDRPLSLAVSRVIVQRLWNYYQSLNSHNQAFRLGSVLPELARRLDAGVYPEALQELSRHSGDFQNWKRVVDILLNTLEFRYQMMEELKK